jgi:hypothetical protein
MLAVLPVLLLGGCGSRPETTPVQGQLVIAGQQADQVSVVLVPDSSSGAQNWRAHGMTDSAGQFTLQCEDGTSGAVPGEYRVILDDLKVYANPRNNEPPQEREQKRIVSRIPKAYRSAGTTPLKVEVKLGGPEIVLEVKP